MNGNPLTNVLTPRARGVLYAVLFVAALVFSAYQAADGDILLLIGGVLTALMGATAASNASFTPTDGDEPPPPEPPYYDETSMNDAMDAVHGGEGVSDSAEGDPALRRVTRGEPPYRGEHEA